MASIHFARGASQQQISLESILKCGRQSLSLCYLGSVLSLDHPNSAFLSLFAEQPCRLWLGTGEKRGDEAGYPAQQSTSPYIQEHLTEVREGVLQKGNP